VDTNMSNDKHEINGTERSVAKERPRKTAVGQLRNKRRKEWSAAPKGSFPRTGNNSEWVHTKR